MRAEVEACIRHSGIQDAQAGVVGIRLLKIDDSARNKDDQRYREAVEKNGALNRQLLVVVTVIAPLSLLIG